VKRESPNPLAKTVNVKFTVTRGRGGGGDANTTHTTMHATTPARGKSSRHHLPHVAAIICDDHCIAGPGLRGLFRTPVPLSPLVLYLCLAPTPKKPAYRHRGPVRASVALMKPVGASVALTTNRSFMGVTSNGPLCGRSVFFASFDRNLPDASAPGTPELRRLGPRDVRGLCHLWSLCRPKLVPKGHHQHPTHFYEPS